MTQLVSAHTPSAAWLVSAQALLNTASGKAAHLAVSFPGAALEEPHVRHSLDAFLQAERRRTGDDTVLPVHSVANTLFPGSLYRQGISGARERLYRAQARIQDIQRRVPANRGGTYFDRLIACPGPDGTVLNQLEHTVEKLSRERARLSSRYELSLLDGVQETPLPEETQEDLRVYLPWKDSRKTIGFPCLSHLSLTLMDGQLHLAATYRNQHFARKAYGNYLGLQRLLLFFCAETGHAPGEILCLATHADLEIGQFGRRRLEHLLKTCQSGALLVAT